MSENLDKVFLALSDPHRLKLFTLIVEACKICDAEGEDFTYRGNCITNLQSHLDVSQSTTSHHIAILKEAGLVKTVRKGKWIHLFPVKETMNTLGKFVYDLIDLSISKSDEVEKIKIENITEENFAELISLIENHGVKTIHYGTTTKYFVSYKGSAFEVTLEDKYISLKTLSNITSRKTIQELTILVKKYMPSIK